jgi:hypothetical protein
VAHHSQQERLLLTRVRITLASRSLLRGCLARRVCFRRAGVYGASTCFHLLPLLRVAVCGRATLQMEAGEHAIERHETFSYSVTLSYSVTE